MSNCLKASRVASGLRQEDVAKRLNIATGTISTFEGNVEQIRLRDFKRWFNLCSDEGKAVIREYLRTNFFLVIS